MKVACVISGTSLLADVTDAVKAEGHNVVIYETVAEAAKNKARLIFAEWTEGPLLAQLLRDLHCDTENEARVVVLAPAGSVTAMRRALSAGATDVLFCPVVAEEICAEIEEIDNPGQGFDPVFRDTFNALRREVLVGESNDFLKCLEEMKIAARCDANVLLCGETGTGKEMFAKAIHRLSRRSGGAYIPVVCASFPETLLQSELFGRVKGAFTGSNDDRKGRFEEVGAGTLLLDEIDSCDLAAQTTLLRVIEAREFSRLGENKIRPFHGRLISATKKNLDELVANGIFRNDLLGRIRQFCITLPPLRKRTNDIPILAWHFLEKHSHGRKVNISPSAMIALRNYPFPENVRQLKGTIEAALARSEPAALILPHHLPKQITTPEVIASQGASEMINIPQGVTYSKAREMVCREFDKMTLGALLRKHNNNQSRAAEDAGIDRKTFSTRIADFPESLGDETYV